MAAVHPIISFIPAWIGNYVTNKIRDQIHPKISTAAFKVWDGYYLPIPKH